MDQATFEQILAEPKWYGVIDMLVMLIIGLLTGATIAYGVVLLQQPTSIVVPTTTIQGQDGKTIELPAGAKLDNA
jgi:hypothetical protein